MDACCDIFSVLMNNVTVLREKKPRALIICSQTPASLPAGHPLLGNQCGAVQRAGKHDHPQWARACGGHHSLFQVRVIPQGLTIMNKAFESFF